ncbi:MAG: TMEM14 family protein [Chthonomonas sp.]|nr:TMEM14 family protein [Chthonomonas sp.]
MAWPRALVGLYGLFNIAVGVEAYSSKNSIASLIAAGTIGVLLLICFALVPKNPRIGYIGATLISLLVAVQFSMTTRDEANKMKFVGLSETTWKPWPNLTLWAVGLGVACALLAAHFMAKGKSLPASSELGE